ncbi:MAG: hypothetical protein ABI411_19835 [Tahibacter sp.]
MEFEVTCISFAEPRDRTSAFAHFGGESPSGQWLMSRLGMAHRISVGQRFFVLVDQARRYLQAVFDQDDWTIRLEDDPSTDHLLRRLPTCSDLKLFSPQLTDWPR